MKTCPILYYETGNFIAPQTHNPVLPTKAVQGVAARAAVFPRTVSVTGRQAAVSIPCVYVTCGHAAPVSSACAISTTPTDWI